MPQHSVSGTCNPRPRSLWINLMLNKLLNNFMEKGAGEPLFAKGNRVFLLFGNRRGRNSRKKSEKYIRPQSPKDISCRIYPKGGCRRDVLIQQREWDISHSYLQPLTGYLSLSTFILPEWKLISCTNPTKTNGHANLTLICTNQSFFKFYNILTRLSASTDMLFRLSFSIFLLLPIS